MTKKWYQSKTIWTGIAGLITTVGAYVSGEIEAAQAAQLILTSLIGIFLRKAV